MKKVILCTILIILLSSCTQNNCIINKDTPTKSEKIQKELVLERIVTFNCDGSYLDVELKKGKGMFENKIVVSRGSCIILAFNFDTKEKTPFPSSSEFLIDKKLEFVIEGEWDGKCRGARHTLIGTIEFYDYEFISDENNPHVFMMSEKGYQYLQGKGRVNDLKGDRTYMLDDSK